jgi:hypothetical protein
MRFSKFLFVVSVLLLSVGSVGCSLSVDQILEMQDGSGVDLAIVSADGTTELPQGRLEFEGGTAMRIDVSTSLLDYLDGTMDGDVEVLDLLFAVPGFQFLIVNTGLVCVVLDEAADNGGTFQYDLANQAATFDVFIGTRAIPVQGLFGSLIRNGAFEFPFDLQSTIPLTLVDALGLFTGTGSLEVTQDLDAFYTVPLINVKNDPSQDNPLPVHVTGTVTLQSVDTFPFTPLMSDCLDALGGGSI